MKRWLSHVQVWQFLAVLDRDHREIEADIEAARKEFQSAWDWHQSAIAGNQPPHFVKAEWERSQQVFREKIDALNKRIRDYNLQVPNARFQRPILNYDREVENITSSKV